jgi:chromosome segregation ATPase
MSNEHTTTHLPAQPAPEAAVDDPRQEDLERVREIILGSDQARTRLRRAETDRLRDILFGAQIEDYERRLTDMRRELDRAGGDMRQVQERLAELEKSLTRRFETIDLELRRIADEMRREQERQRNRDALFQQLAAQVRQHEETIVGTAESVIELKRSSANHDADIRAGKAELIDARDQIEQRTQSLRREIRQSEDTLRAELRRLTDRLENQKTDRRALASMLIEIATRLETGNTVTGMLEGLSDPKE